MRTRAGAPESSRLTWLTCLAHMSGSHVASVSSAGYWMTLKSMQLTVTSWFAPLIAPDPSVPELPR